MNKRVNTGRQKELDIAKGLAVIFMVLIHTTEYYWDEESFIFGKVANFLGSPPAAPVFMFLLGCGIIYSRHNSAAELAKRGVKMLGLSYVFNALVYVLPYGIYSLVNRDIECWEDSWSQIYDADILQFAALAFLFCALIRFLKMKPWQGLTAAIIITLIGMGLNNTITDLENPVLQAVTGLFWGTHEGSYFPFTSWIIFVAAGYVFAERLQCTENKKRLYLCISPIGGILFLIFAKLLTYSHEWDAMMDGEYYYHQDILMNVMYVAFVLAWLGVCFFISAILPELLSNVLKRFSTNVTVIYVMQYILIIYIQVLVTGETVFSAPIVLGITVLYTVIAYYGAIAYKKYTAKRTTKTVNKRKIVQSLAAH